MLMTSDKIVTTQMMHHKFINNGFKYFTTDVKLIYLMEMICDPFSNKNKINVAVFYSNSNLPSYNDCINLISIMMEEHITEMLLLLTLYLESST